MPLEEHDCVVFIRDELCKCCHFIPSERRKVFPRESCKFSLVRRQNNRLLLRSAPENRKVQRGGIENEWTVHTKDNAADCLNIFWRFGHARTNDTGIDMLEERENALCVAFRKAVSLERVHDEVQRRPQRHRLVTSMHNRENEIDAACLRSKCAENWRPMETVTPADDGNTTILAFVGLRITLEHG